MTAISVENVSKHFQIPLDRSNTLKYRITHWRSASRYRDFYALKDVSFTVPEGQFLGITGHNGCGKSTLLKILSRIYKQDSGRVVVTGHVSPFLELGVGFNPELTARENIFLGGAVLGLTRKQLYEQIDSILDFADLNDFADQKLKNYSSGMQVRLAFSVAVQANADILLMDEVLAVGDARFQEKCFNTFAKYKREGRTIVLVTHDLGSLNLYCDRVLLLKNGELVVDGPASEVTAKYRRMVGTQMDESTEKVVADTQPDNRWGSREVEITGVRILGKDKKPHTTFHTSEPAIVQIDYAVHEKVKEFVCGLAFKRAEGLNISGPNSKIGGYRIPCPDPGSTGTVSYSINSLPLLGGSYILTAALYDEHCAHPFDHIEDIKSFRVVDEKGQHGIVELNGKWHDTSVENAARHRITA